VTNDVVKILYEHNILKPSDQYEQKDINLSEIEISKTLVKIAEIIRGEKIQKFDASDVYYIRKNVAEVKENIESCLNVLEKKTITSRNRNLRMKLFTCRKFKVS
jgi:hypothetical protein